MTNPERDPQETVATTGDVECGIEVLTPRDVPLGGPRAMHVRRTLPQRERSLIGAWCFVDHYGPDLVADSGGMSVAPHPHTGLQTVSWLFEGEIEHRDSAGNHAMVRPGEVNLMTAGQRDQPLGGLDGGHDRAARRPALGGPARCESPRRSRGSRTTRPTLVTGQGWDGSGVPRLAAR